MRRLKGAIEFLLVLVVVPIALFLAISIAIASLTGLLAYLGGLLAAWLLFAYVVPLTAGIMTRDEILDGIRSQRRDDFEGEPLRADRAWWAHLKPKAAWWARWNRNSGEGELLLGGGRLPEDRALGSRGSWATKPTRRFG